MKKVTVISTSLRPDATHCDLYDGSEGNCIPWDSLAEFLERILNSNHSLTASERMPIVLTGLAAFTEESKRKYREGHWEEDLQKHSMQAGA